MTYGSTRDGSINPYELELITGLPPGTDEVRQLRDEPRLPPSVDVEKRRTLPKFPPVEQRTGKWITRYLSQVGLPQCYLHMSNMTLV
jgi:hypothetical protein